MHFKGIAKFLTIQSNEKKPSLPSDNELYIIRQSPPPGDEIPRLRHKAPLMWLLSLIYQARLVAQRFIAGWLSVYPSHLKPTLVKPRRG